MLIYFVSSYVSYLILFLARLARCQLASKLLCALFLLIFISVPGLRVGVGTDYYSYVKWFEEINFYEFTYVNFAFDILLRSLKLFYDNPQGMFFASSVIISMLIWTFIKQNSRYVELSVFLFIFSYLYFSTFNIMRQWIAISIFLYAVKYIYERSMSQYIATILLASMFHITAFILMPLYWLSDMKKRWVLLFLSCVFMILYNIADIVNLIIPITPLSALSQEKYMAYVSGIFADNGGGGYAYLCISIFTALALVVQRKKYVALFPRQYPYHLFFVLLCTILSLFAPYNVFYVRIQLYFMPFVMVSLSNSVFCAHRTVQVVYYFILITSFSLYLYKCLMFNAGEVVPYVFVDMLF